MVDECCGNETTSLLARLTLSAYAIMANNIILK